MPVLSSVLFKIVGLGLLTGVRSMAGPALVLAVSSGRTSRLRNLLSPRRGRALRMTQALAVGEMIGDKLPGIPNRNAPGPLAGRALMGAIAGGSMYRLLGRRGGPGTFLGASLGSLGAVAGAVGAFRIRRFIGRGRGIPGFVLGVMEDVLVAKAGKRILASLR